MRYEENRETRMPLADGRPLIVHRAIVRPTDCRTGWQVVIAGRPIATYRRIASANAHAEELNQNV